MKICDYLLCFWHLIELLLCIQSLKVIVPYVSGGRGYFLRTEFYILSHLHAENKVYMCSVVHLVMTSIVVYVHMVRLLLWNSGLVCSKL